MTAKALSVLGTSSHVGKTWMVAGLCRVFRDRGIRVAPFKAQNMSLNAYITREGAEISYAQALQAWSAGIAPHRDMNPILLKPQSAQQSQLIVHGQVQGAYGTHHFRYNRDELFRAVTESYDRLAAQYDVVIIEGAGSPVELNLMHTDLSNVRMAEYADADMILVGDIDRGGIFASLYGTVALLPETVQTRLKGLIINKFRGDATLFTEGVQILQSLTHQPVLGVVPHVPLQFPEEDSLGVPQGGKGSARVTVVVPTLPYMSNFTDFDPLRMEPDVDVIFTSDLPSEPPDLVVVPGSKNTLADLAWLKRSGWSDAIKKWAYEGIMVAGICGGYQMLGESVRDPLGVESHALPQEDGLGLLPIETVLTETKITRQVSGFVCAGPWQGEHVHGYELHMGDTTRVESQNQTRYAPLFSLDDRSDGLTTEDGHIWGTYLHGVFHNPEFRHRIIRQLGARSLLAGDVFESVIRQWKEVIEQYVDIAALIRLVGG